RILGMMATWMSTTKRTETSMAVAEPYGRPRDFVARMAGLGRPVLWSLAVTSVLGVVAGIAGGAWAIYETGRSADAIQRYVVYLDAGMAPVAGQTHEISRLKATLDRAISASRGKGDLGRFINFKCMLLARLVALPQLTTPCALIGLISCVCP